MRSPSAPTFAAWLCLAAASIMGLAPAQALVFCLGPEGTIALEVRLEAGRCGGCPEIGPQQSRNEVAANVADASDCPCIDIPVHEQDAGAPVRPNPLEHGPRTVAPPICALELPHAPCALHSLAQPPARGPEVAPVLARIRSVVLVV